MPCSHHSTFIYHRHRSAALSPASPLPPTPVIANIPGVPFDVWWHILRCLQEDYSALLACMEVCKSWREISQLVIRDEVVFSDRKEIALAAKRSSNMRWKGPTGVRISGKRTLSKRGEDKLIPAPRLVRDDARAQVDASPEACNRACELASGGHAFGSVSPSRDVVEYSIYVSCIR